MGVYTFCPSFDIYLVYVNIFSISPGTAAFIGELSFDTEGYDSSKYVVGGLQL